MIFTILETDMKSKINFIKITAVLSALLFWQILAILINRSYLLSSPIEVIKSLWSFIPDKTFWLGMGRSLAKILFGFILGAVFGSLLAYISYIFKTFEIFISPYIGAIRSTPVASIVIIILIWLGSDALSIVVCFLMVMPIFYAGILEGFKSVDIKMLQMAELFKISKKAGLVYIYMPALESFIISAAKASLGIAFKSGIAAEVIARSKMTLGYFLFDAKMYLETSKVFAVTLIVVVCSTIFERLAMLLLKRFFKLIKRLY